MEQHAYLTECERMIKQGSTTFYEAFRFLPSPRKEAVHVIYAFCRMIDDSVDEPHKSPYTLDELEYHFDRLDEATGHFIWPALRWLFETFPASKKPFFQQMEGQRRDYVVTHYDTLEQLEQYCYLVAGTVGEMLLPVLHDEPDAQIVASGIALGKAMQIVNIVRDVGEDRERGRRYVPKSVMDDCGYTEEQFLRGDVNEAWIRVVEVLSEQAKQWFATGLRDLDAYPKKSAFCMELAAGYYGAILDEVRESGYDSFTKRAIVGAKRKTLLLLPIVKRYGFGNGQEAVS